METFGAMAKTEKIAFILEQVCLYIEIDVWLNLPDDSTVPHDLQVRLCLDHGDFMRAIILARKVNPRVFNEDASAKKKEGDTVVEPPAPDIPTLLELKLKFYELMIRFGHLTDRCPLLPQYYTDLCSSGTTRMQGTTLRFRGATRQFMTPQQSKRIVPSGHL